MNRISVNIYKSIYALLNYINEPLLEDALMKRIEWRCRQELLQQGLLEDAAGEPVYKRSEVEKVYIVQSLAESAQNNNKVFCLSSRSATVQQLTRPLFSPFPADEEGQVPFVGRQEDGRAEQRCSHPESLVPGKVPCVGRAKEIRSADHSQGYCRMISQLNIVKQGVLPPPPQ